MSIRTSPWPNGVPCWVDLMAPDVVAAGAFYAAVLGWEVSEPAEEYGGYVVALVGGHAVAGISPMQPGARTAWTLYFAADDAEATMAAVAEHGGTVLLPVGDVGETGRMGIAADPSGAVFGVWQAGAMIGAALVNEPGGLVWEDLRSTDPAAAQAFYRGVFGFQVDMLAMAGPDYGTFRLPAEQAPLGGMGGMMDSAEGTPSHWLVSFAVADVDAALVAAGQAGGSVTMPAKDTAFGRIGGVRDPYGAELVLMTLPAGAPQPDRAG